MKLVLIKCIIAIIIGLTSTAHAQVMPNHFDPNSREIELDLSTVPAIRFLTTPDYPPFNYRDEGGQLIGFNIDLAHEICEVLEIACTMQSWPWEQAGDALADKQGDVLLAGLAITPENGKFFDFSHIYLQFPGRFIVKRSALSGFVPELWQFVPTDGQVDIDNPVAVRDGSNHQKYLTEYFPLARLVAFDTEFDALEAVATGAAYAYFGDGLRGAFWLNENTQCCDFAGEAYFDTSYFGQGLAAALPFGHDQVRRAINVALFRLQREGVLDNLYLKWFPIGFY